MLILNLMLIIIALFYYKIFYFYLFYLLSFRLHRLLMREESQKVEWMDCLQGEQTVSKVNIMV